MADENEIDFGDLEPIRQVITLTRNKVKHKYIVMEASSPAATAYRNANATAVRRQGDGSVRLEGIHDSELGLVGDCVFDIQNDGVTPHDVPIGKAVVRGWPHRVTAGIYDLVRKLSPRLVEKDTVETLGKKIADLTKQRDELILLEGKPDPKDPASSTEDISASAGSSASSSTS